MGVTKALVFSETEETNLDLLVYWFVRHIKINVMLVINH